MFRLNLFQKRRHRPAQVVQPDWSIHDCYYDLSNHMNLWRTEVMATPEDMLAGPMPQLLELCFVKSKNGAVRARTMEFYRSWAKDIGKIDSARNMVEERLRADPGQAWLLQVFDGELGHHSGPRY